MLEKTILSQLIFNEDFTRKTLPHLTPDYFNDPNQKIVFALIAEFFAKYNALPSKETLLIDMANKPGIKEDTFEECETFIQELEKDDTVNFDWLVDQTEKFCQEKAVYNAIMASIQIIDGRDKTRTSTSIPALLSAALGVSFDINIGHDYLEDAEARYDFYNLKENRIPLGLHYMDMITGGGIPRKTLNAILAGINVGKTLDMCDFAARYFKQGYNVLYITMEIAEQRIAERIDQNIMNITNEDLLMLDKMSYMKKIDRIKEESKARIEIKEYPTAGASAANFRYLMDELRIKKNFIPDVVFIDYVNICSSSRFKQGSNVNSYTYVKSIAEELRGLMVEYNCVGWTATQLTREGLNASDFDMDDVSESIGLPAALDLFMGVISNEDLEKKSHVLFKQLKNRYRNKSKNRRFVMGVNIDKQCLFDVDESEQGEYADAPVMDSTPTGKEMSGAGKKFDKNKFDQFT